MTPLTIFLLALISLLFTLTSLAISPAARHVQSPVCQDAATIPAAATTAIHAHLAALVNSSTFFSVFEVALEKSCPFWDESSMCTIRDCSVHNCSDAEVPPAWRHTACPPDAARPAAAALNDVDRSRTGLAALVADPFWLAADSAAWTVRDARDDTVFVDLRRNPERYTGYRGPSSERVWQAVYDENCLTFSPKCRSGICAPDTCKEERVLYSLISGLHASITMHIAKDYLLAEGKWGPNPQIYRARIRPFPERVANLNVAFALVLRAVGKAADALHPANYSYRTGDVANDRDTKEKLEALFQFPQLQRRCQRRAFDESDMFVHGHDGLLPEFRRAFRNISTIMDCVGCEKCRLWGKLQFLGLGTALRILFEPQIPDLERNEIIALVNLLYKLSTSVLWVDKMEKEIVARDNELRQGAVAFLAIFLALIAYRFMSMEPKVPSQPTERKVDKAANDKEKAATDVKNVDAKKSKAPPVTTRTRRRKASAE